MTAAEAALAVLRSIATDGWLTIDGGHIVVDGTAALDPADAAALAAALTGDPQ